MKEIDWSKAPEGYDFALSTAADWNGAPELKGTVRFASRDGLGRFKDDTGMHPQIGRSSWEVIAERPVSWAGEGLPPVGACVVVHDDGSLMYGHGESGEVIAHVENTAVVRMSYGLGCFTAECLRTPEQIAAEEREKAIEEMARIGTMADTPKSMAAKLYDAGCRMVTP